MYYRGEGTQHEALHAVGNLPEGSMFQHGQSRNEGQEWILAMAATSSRISTINEAEEKKI